MAQGDRDGPGQSEHKAWLEAHHRLVKSVDISQVVRSSGGFMRRVLARKFSTLFDGAEGCVPGWGPLALPWSRVKSRLQGVWETSMEFSPWSWIQFLAITQSLRVSLRNSIRVRH